MFLAFVVFEQLAPQMFIQLLVLFILLLVVLHALGELVPDTWDLLSQFMRHSKPCPEYFIPVKSFPLFPALKNVVHIVACENWLFCHYECMWSNVCTSIQPVMTIHWYIGHHHTSQHTLISSCITDSCFTLYHTMLFTANECNLHHGIHLPCCPVREQKLHWRKSMHYFASISLLLQ